MTFRLVDAGQSLPKGKAVKLTFFAHCSVHNDHNINIVLLCFRPDPDHLPPPGYDDMFM